MLYTCVCFPNLLSYSIVASLTIHPLRWSLSVFTNSISAGAVERDHGNIIVRRDFVRLVNQNARRRFQLRSRANSATRRENDPAGFCGVVATVDGR